MFLRANRHWITFQCLSTSSVWRGVTSASPTVYRINGRDRWRSGVVDLIVAELLHIHFIMFEVGHSDRANVHPLEWIWASDSNISFESLKRSIVLKTLPFFNSSDECAGHLRDSRPQVEVAIARLMNIWPLWRWMSWENVKGKEEWKLWWEARTRTTCRRSNQVTRRPTRQTIDYNSYRHLTGCKLIDCLLSRAELAWKRLPGKRFLTVQVPLHGIYATLQVNRKRREHI